MPTPTPMPGAVAGITRLPFETKKHAGWNDLSAGDAINFINASPVTLATGTTIYRVYGGPAGMGGSYWSPIKPPITQTEADWRGSNAVELSWNSGTDVCEVKLAFDLKVWGGGIAPQPAQDTACQYLPGYLLPGGAQQYKVFDRLTPVPAGKTPWPAGATCPVVPPAPVVPVSNAAAHVAHAELVGQLGEVLLT